MINEVEQSERYGDFKENAGTMQLIKDLMRKSNNWALMPFYQKESLDMIAHHIGVILTGNSDEIDFWQKISTYAQLVEMELTPACGPVMEVDTQKAWKEMTKHQPQIEDPDGIPVISWTNNIFGEQPVDDDVLVEVKFKDGKTEIRRAGRWTWCIESLHSTSTIIQFRILSDKEVKEHKANE